MRRKFLSVIAMMFVLLVTFTNIYAVEGMFHLKAYSDIYKLSEELDGIDLPFINVFEKAATYDKAVTHSGISIGETTIDVEEKLEGVHVLFSNDMITIKGEVEHAIIYGSNVVVEGKISNDTIIFAPTVQILEGATVERDVIIVANKLDLKGTVKGNVIATVSEKATIAGTIEQDLRIMATDLSFENEKINGDIYIETNADVTTIKEKYPNATIQTLVEDENTTDWMSIVTKGIILVVIYSLICIFVTKKDNNIAHRAYQKIKNNTTYGVLVAAIMIMLVFILPIILIVIAVFGLGLIAWPILIAYLGILLFVISTATLIVGTTIFAALKEKAGKYKIIVAPLIFTVLYVLTLIPVISGYANMAIILLALATVITMITRKLPVSPSKEQK